MSKEYITSTYGIRIYICCASCHKNVHGKSRRRQRLLKLGASVYQ